MSRRERGLYETLITEALEADLGTLSERLHADRSDLHEAEAADRLALHLSRVLERALGALEKKERVAVGTALTRQLVDIIVGSTTRGTTSRRARASCSLPASAATIARSTSSARRPT